MQTNNRNIRHNYRAPFTIITTRGSVPICSWLRCFSWETRIIYVSATIVYYRDSVLELWWSLVKYRQALPKYSEKISPDHTLLHATSAAAYQIKLTICSCVWYIIYIYMYIVLRCSGPLSTARSYTTCCFFLRLRFQAVEKNELGASRAAAYIPTADDEPRWCQPNRRKLTAG